MITQPQIRDLYTLVNAGCSESTLYEAVKHLKDAKERGVKGTSLNPKKRDVNDARVRTKLEIEQMLDYVMEQAGSGLASRALAWAVGNISNGEFQETLESYCRQRGKPFTPKFLDAKPMFLVPGEEPRVESGSESETASEPVAELEAEMATGLGASIDKQIQATNMSRLQADMQKELNTRRYGA
jgi:hypothetical protein